MSYILRFHITRAVSPWNHKTNKAVHCSTRASLLCTSTEYVPVQPNEPAVSTSIFVYQWKDNAWHFSHVASPVDLQKHPLISAVENNTEKPDWARSDKVDLLLPSFEVAHEFLDNTEADVLFLAREISSCKTLLGETNYTVDGTIENE